MVPKNNYLGYHMTNLKGVKIPLIISRLHETKGIVSWQTSRLLRTPTHVVGVVCKLPVTVSLFENSDWSFKLCHNLLKLIIIKNS